MTRVQRRRLQNKKLLRTTIALLILTLMTAAFFFLLSGDTVPASAGLVKPGSLLDEYLAKWHAALLSGISGMPGGADKTVKIFPQISLQGIARGIMFFCTGIDFKDPGSLLRAEIPRLASLKQGKPTVSAMTLPNFPKFDPKKMLPPGKPLVGIYHTHTSESFIPTSGSSHKPGGQIGDIVNVGAALAQKLDQNGVKAVHNRQIHDFPSFMKAYGPAEATVKNMLAENPSIQMIFDIHRDADKRANATAVINGLSAAKISIVVATGQQDLVQPHWQQNHAFAKLIDARLNQHYPGLSKGIQLVEWRYNQHLHPRALLIEVGCQENTEEEAIRSVEMFADVIAEILSENSD